MNLQCSRTLSLIEFAQQSARLRGKTPAAVSAYGLLAIYEHQIQGLPGIRINVSDPVSNDEIWLSITRLHETNPPEIADPILRPWVDVSPYPTREPRLYDTIDAAGLISAGTHRLHSDPAEHGKPVIDPTLKVLLSNYDRSVNVRAQFAAYLDNKWRPWAEAERPRRRTIQYYSQLFTLKQQLEGSIVESQLELVWGVGIGIWTTAGASVNYPLVGRLCDLTLNTATSELEVRPRDVDPRLEIDWYASIDNPGVPHLENAGKQFFSIATTTFSPFDRDTFEPLLRTAASNLDANGIYWPNIVSELDRTIPKADNNLKITDTWVLFARPRTNNVFLQDLERLKQIVESADVFPPALTAIVTDPVNVNTAIELPPFRGLSTSLGMHSSSTTVVRDVYFPLAYNDEQFRIAQLLDVSDGVVVQGPPGTGKTRTIANIICHYLAEGKRVLVTSMKDPALREVQEKLPDDIRPLAISLLASEQDGMRQFEHAIQKIAAEVQSLDRSSTTKLVSHLTERIDELHGKLAKIDSVTGEWARRDLAKIILESEEIDPQQAAREVTLSNEQLAVMPDMLGTALEFAPQFQDSDIVRLREARRELGRYIDYLYAEVPQLVEFPDSKTVLEVHQDLAQFEKLKRRVDNGDVPALADSSQETLVRAQQVLLQIEHLSRLRERMAQTQSPWLASMRERLQRGGSDDLIRIFESLGAELDQVVERRKTFLERPVALPDGIEQDPEILDAVRNLSEGKSPFGLKGLFGKQIQKKLLDSIRVLDAAPADAATWAHAGEYILLQKQLRQLGIRWNAIAGDLRLPKVPNDRAEGTFQAVQEFSHYVNLKNSVHVERQLCVSASTVFPHWPFARDVASNTDRLSELEMALRHHLTKNRLANVWAAKERFQKVLEGREGRIIDDLRRFLASSLGNPAVDDSQMQAEWSSLMAELSRVHGLASQLAVVSDVTGLISASGASDYAKLLQQPLESTVDHLLPSNWREIWRLRRLATHLQSVDAQDVLSRLANERKEVEGDLSRAYRDIVVKKTWLKLAENASPSVRSALQAYLNAIQRIGKGTGKRAVRYRQEARQAASHANSAVPCWIMPHYRISESLPAELGCFDLVIIDEASQSDLTALPSLLRAKKVLIVGDDKQVSPEGVGLEEEKIRSLMERFLRNQVETYRPQMSPEKSIYDLFKVVFASSSIMLKEHFRCVGPIIEYSKREFYKHELRPLRVPKGSERLDPPLIDVVVQDGYRQGDINRPEARFIVEEIKSIVSDPIMARRTIGVVSLLADKQALDIHKLLLDEIGPELMLRHKIECGDARTFQGKERNIMFLSMVSAPNNVGAPLSRDTFRQRFNVAASRAQDRMYLVRSVELDQLSQADELRRSLILHFKTPFAQDEGRAEDMRARCESDFEREMFDELTQRGYWVTSQVNAGQYRIDMVVEGHNDARLAIECDGDIYHGPDKWADDMDRQRTLERAGWTFWRCFASAFIRRRKEVLDELIRTLTEHAVEPIGAEGAPRSVHTECRVVSSRPYDTDQRDSLSLQTDQVDVSEDLTAVPLEALVTSDSEDAPSKGAIPLPSRDALISSSSGDSRNHDANFVIDQVDVNEYAEYTGIAGSDPRKVSVQEVADGLVRIVSVEGPMVAKRAYDIYLRSCGIKRIGPDLKSTLNRALHLSIRRREVISEDEAGTNGIFFSIVRISGSTPIRLRNRGSRIFEEIPPSELQVVAKCLQDRYMLRPGSEDHLRAILEFYDLKRLTMQVNASLLEILENRITYVDEYLSSLRC